MSTLRRCIAHFKELLEKNPDSFNTLSEFRPTGIAYNNAFDTYYEVGDLIQKYIDSLQDQAERHTIAESYQPEFTSMGD